MQGRSQLHPSEFTRRPNRCMEHALHARRMNVTGNGLGGLLLLELSAGEAVAIAGTGLEASGRRLSMFEQRAQLQPSKGLGQV